MEKIEVKKVINPSKEILDITSKWMFDWWGRKKHYDYDAVYYYMKYSFNDKKLPQTYALFLNNKIIGMYQITYNDLFIRPDIYPWIANLYIDKKYRNKGYGKILINSIKEMTANNTNFKEIFLYTHHVNLYEKFGWKFVSSTEIKGENLYKFDLY